VLVVMPPRPDLTAVGPAIRGVVEQALDSVVARAVAEPLPVHSPDDVRAAVEGSSNATVTTFVAPAVTGVAKRFSNRVVGLGSKMSFSVKALLAAVPPLAASVTLGTRELHALASFVVNRLRAADVPVDRRFVQRVTVNAYVWPGGGRDLEAPQAVAVLRVAGLWATRPLAHERHGEWVGRAAEAIAAADLADRYGRYTCTRAEGPPGP
jgi:hypothetical protein